MIVYNKLVRDKIPDIIKKSGKKSKIYTLNEDEYIKELDKKLNEEIDEYQSDKNLEELADILEVVYSIAEARGYSVNELESIRLEKAEKRGSFKDKIFLEYVEE